VFADCASQRVFLFFSENVKLAGDICSQAKANAILLYLGMRSFEFQLSCKNQLLPQTFQKDWNSRHGTLSTLRSYPPTMPSAFLLIRLETSHQSALPFR
jgi:hypothetical protein